jgi:protein SCO1/2
MKLLLRRLTLFFLAALGAGSSAIQGQEAGALAVYDAHGLLKAYNPMTHQATIAHDAIPGYMQAMTMDFDARSPDEFASLSPGDILSFHLCVTASTAWIDHVLKTGVSSQVLEPPAAAVAVRELVAGDLAPDVELADENGKHIRLSDFRGEAVALTFIYTGCPLPTYCPLMTQYFSQTQGLMTRMDPGGRWQLLSISMDPAHDTPQVLAAFASACHADPAHWTFATGDESSLKHFGAAFGLEFQRTGQQISHNLRTVVLDSTGHVRSVYSGNSWTPQQLASDLRAAVRHPMPPGKQQPP